MKLSTRILGWAIAAFVVTLRWTCRVRCHNDPRPELDAAGESYVHAILHAHQIAIGSKAVPGTMAMASQSADGQLLAPTFRALGVPLVRGSSARDGRARGGVAAIDQMAEHVGAGGLGVIAVDGPRGPRGRVRKGVAKVGVKTGCPIVCVIIRPSRRLVIRKAWDRFQTPLPLCRYDAYFDVVRPTADDSVESVRRRVEQKLNALEARWDPQEAAHSAPPREAASTDPAAPKPSSTDDRDAHAA
ncbi:MAG: DUF374 domain-containing protein [Planctomycetota bacterium]